MYTSTPMHNLVSFKTSDMFCVMHLYNKSGSELSSTTHFYPPSHRATVNAVLDLIGDEHYSRQAILALGGLSRLLSTTNPELANGIVDTLHSLLDQLSGKNVLEYYCLIVTEYNY